MNQSTSQPEPDKSTEKISLNKAVIVAFVIFVIGLIITFFIAGSGGNQETSVSQSTSADNSSKSSAETNSQAVLKAGYFNWSNQADFEAYSEFERWLYFHADWCPKCVALDKDILDNLDQIPEDLVIFKVDYDQNQALRQRYGVSLQTTVVKVDSQANLQAKFVGTSTNHSLTELLKKLQ